MEIVTDIIKEYDINNTGKLDYTGNIHIINLRIHRLIYETFKVAFS